MKVEKVQDNKSRRLFLNLVDDLYAGDPNYIRPLDQDIERIFDPEKNHFFRHGACERWILENSSGKTIGRVAAFINDRTYQTFDQPTGGMGFFECIEDQSAANLLFDTCKKWLLEQKKGIEAMDGPINFGEKDAWWGLMVGGFSEPVYQMNYHPSYYLRLFESYGFQTYYKQFVFGRHLHDPAPEHYREKFELLKDDDLFEFRHLERKKLSQYTKDFVNIYNKAWGKHDGFRSMTLETATRMMAKLKPILAEELMWFGYHDGEPVAFFFMIPDMNQVFKHFNGKFGLWQKVRTWWMLRRGKINKCYGAGFGVCPDFQGHGIDGGIITAAAEHLNALDTWGPMEMTWIGDFNPKMIHIAEGVGGKVTKTYQTMRYLFDRDKEFKRAPIID